MVENPRLTIGMLWHSVNSGNLGVGALTLSNLALVRAAAAQCGVTPHFLMLGFVDPGRAPYVTGDDVEIIRLNSRAMLPGGAYDRALRRCDAVIDIGGGDSFTDIYGPKRFAFLWWSKWRALRKGLPLLLAPQTIGPFSRPLPTRLAASAMARAALVVARDPASFAAAQAMAPHAHLLQAVDVAFALPSQPWPRTDDRTTVGLNVSGLLFNRGYDGKSSFGMTIDYAAYTRGLITALFARADLRVVLVPHVNSDAVPVDDDGRVADQLMAEFPALERVGPFVDPVEAKSCIASLDFLVAGRMHACIAAYSSGVAVFPVAYSRKFSGLFEGVLGYPHLLPVTGVGTQQAIERTLAAFDQRATLAAATIAGRAKATQLLAGYQAALVTLLQSAQAVEHPAKQP